MWKDEKTENGKPLSLLAIANRLNGERQMTRTGFKWSATAVMRVLDRIDPNRSRT